MEDVALLLTRLMLGGFFILARFRWVWDPSRPDQPWFNHSRHTHLWEKLRSCGYPGPLAPLVSLVELFAGLGVFFGFLTHLSAFGLFVVLIFATVCTAREKTAKQNPIDRIDWLSCYLWTVEPVYLTMAFSLCLTGGGLYSLDTILYQWWV